MPILGIMASQISGHLNLEIGYVIPNGGMVFYDAGSVLSWGRYIAAAPQSWNGGSDPNINWSNVNNNISTSDGIGTGETNTDAMMADNSNVAFAAGKCRAYTAGGSTWSLPSRDELSAIVGTPVTMQSNVYYWSSSQFGGSSYARMVYFQSGTLQYTGKGTNERVRPICYYTP